MNYAFKTKPFAHQAEVFERSKDAEFFGLLMEQGTGKTKVLIDNAGYLYNCGQINALVVLAPNGVHRNWTLREVPAHLPDYIPHRCAYWSATPGKAEKKAWESVREPGPFLRVVAFNIEALSTDRGFEEAKKFLMMTNAMLVVDESSRIKNPSAVRTKNVLKLARLAKYRRIATGTPVTKAPLDVFTQFNFLEKAFFGTDSFTVFRARYAEMMDADHPLMRHIKMRTGGKYAPPMIATDKDGKPVYKNLDELQKLTQSVSFRVLKKDCLDLPPKIYQTREVRLSPEQARAYKALVDSLKSQANDPSLFEQVFKPVNKLASITFLQQILCGTLPAPMSEDGQSRPLFDKAESNPRIRALLDVLEETDDAVIIWGRFTHDIEQITRALREEYGDRSVVNYYGEVSGADRQTAIDRFQNDPDCRFFVGNAAAGGTGLTLTRASTMVYYSNSFNLEERLQSEDRAHRIGQDAERVLYIDLEVPGTIDSKIVNALKTKKSVADLITGDKYSEWLQ
jgi:SNF2 family DNA or RNA helicase